MQRPPLSREPHGEICGGRRGALDVGVCSVNDAFMPREEVAEAAAMARRNGLRACGGESCRCFQGGERLVVKLLMRRAHLGG
jgi:hypothetical protein